MSPKIDSYERTIFSSFVVKFVFRTNGGIKFGGREGEGVLGWCDLVCVE